MSALSGLLLCVQAGDMSILHRLFHVRPSESSAQPVSGAYQTARAQVRVHAQLDDGQD